MLSESSTSLNVKDLYSTLIEINSDWSKGIRLFPAAANQFNDLMPNIKDIGLRDAGSTYESLTSLIPLSVFGTMIYDVIKNKNQFYFTPIYKEKTFGRNMYVFSLTDKAVFDALSKNFNALFVSESN